MEDGTWELHDYGALIDTKMREDKTLQELVKKPIPKPALTIIK